MNKDSKNMDNTSLRQRIIDMSVHDALVIPVGEFGYTTLRTYASELGFMLERKYSTHLNKTERTYTIVRIA